MRKPSLACFAILLCAASSALAQTPGKWACPEDLRAPALAKRAEMQATEHAVRDSSPKSPLRVEPTQIFDLAAHECHTGRAQVWKVFGDPTCEPGKDAGAFKVVYPYDLYFRRDKEEAAMLSKDWQPGSDGLWQVTFEKVNGVWTALGQREVLDLTGPPKGHGHPEGGKP